MTLSSVANKASVFPVAIAIGAKIGSRRSRRWVDASYFVSDFSASIQVYPETGLADNPSFPQENEFLHPLKQPPR